MNSRHADTFNKKENTVSKKSPESCMMVLEDHYVEGEGYRAAYVTENEPGYRRSGTWPNDGTGVMPIFFRGTFAEAEDRVRRYNESYGCSEAQARAIIASSIRASRRADEREALR